MNAFWRKAAAWAVLAVVVAAIVNWIFGNGNGKDWLYSVSLGFEAVGVVLVAVTELSDVLETARRLTTTTTDTVKFRARLSVRAVKRWLRLKQSVTVHAGAATATMSVGGGVTGVVTRKPFDPTATDDEKFEWLASRVDQLFTQVDTHSQAINALPGQWTRDLKDAVDALRGETLGVLENLRVERLAERPVGIVFLLLGVIVGAAGNLA